ncbi:uncharacterized protein NPIL_210911 [Nephila pilipes]|uniref:Uncharacterized protein n=1 Tax=Nephila pilipes TaxID=299642 RepID=A0A8X6T2B5_NEPPI|nr:uncharacterized protein NPIL_210911 [Nephila pilipes]
MKNTCVCFEFIWCVGPTFLYARPVTSDIFTFLNRAIIVLKLYANFKYGKNSNFFFTIRINYVDLNCYNMDTNSEVNVAKLLQQLEELKKKKAQRLEKLKKIGYRNRKNIVVTTSEDRNNHSTSFQSNQSILPIHNSGNKPEKSASIVNYCNCSAYLHGSTYKCIQCTATVCFENALSVENNSNFKSQSKSTETYKAEDSENLALCTNVSKIFFKNNNSCASKVTDVFNKNPECYEVLNQNIKDLTNIIAINQTLNSCKVNEQNIRKRSTSECSKNAENCENKKKLKMSENILINTHTPMPHEFISRSSYVLTEKNAENNKNNEYLVSTANYENCIESSLSHNTTCFLSSDVLDVENDKNVLENIKKCVHFEKNFLSQDNPKINTQNMASVVKCANSVLSSVSPINQNDNKVSGNNYSENIVDSPSSLKESCETLQEFKKNNESFAVTDTVLDAIEHVKISKPIDASCCILESFPFEAKKSSYVSKQLDNTHNESSAVEIVISSNLKSDSPTAEVVDNTQSNCVMEENFLIPLVYKKSKLLDSHDSANVDQCEYDEEGDGNHTPSLLDCVITKSHQARIKDSSFISKETSIVVKLNNVNEDGLDPDALTADIDFNSSIESVEVNDTVDNFLTDLKDPECPLLYHNELVILPQNVESHSVVKSNAEICTPDSEVFTIPETELFDSSHSNENDTVIENKVCVNNKPNWEKEKDISAMQRIDSYIIAEFNKASNNQILTNVQNENIVTVADSFNICEPFIPKNIQKCDINNFPEKNIFSETLCGTSNQLHTIQETILLEIEDTEELGSCKEFPVAEGVHVKINPSRQCEHPEVSQSNIQLTYSFHNNIGEAVRDIKLVYFNHSNYAFIQHITWIQAWRQEENKNWIKVFSHKVGKLHLKEMCCSMDDNYLVLVMLLSSDQEYCLQFLLFEKEARVIKLMEHTHWLQNKCSENTVLLCGLEDLKFTTAQGNNESFEVFVHVFNCLEENPRLLTTILGSTTGNLKSMCSIEKLPNALMGTSDTTLYVWHLLEARLVISVQLQPPEPIAIESCIWATIENGLVFFISISEDEQGYGMCQLLAANLATGFCQIVMTYTLQALRKSKIFSDKNVKVIYNEPFIAALCKDGAFLWSVMNEYCCAALEDPDATAMAFGKRNDIIIVGNSTSHSWELMSTGAVFFCTQKNESQSIIRTWQEKGVGAPSVTAAKPKLRVTESLLGWGLGERKPSYMPNPA